MSKSNSLLSAIHLLFNLQHPDLEECYLSGYEAAFTGFNEDDNPYVKGTKEFNFWLEGWWTGFYQEESWF